MRRSVQRLHGLQPVRASKSPPISVAVQVRHGYIISFTDEAVDSCAREPCLFGWQRGVLAKGRENERPPIVCHHAGAGSTVDSTQPTWTGATSDRRPERLPQLGSISENVIIGDFLNRIPCLLISSLEQHGSIDCSPYTIEAFSLPHLFTAQTSPLRCRY